MVSSLFLKMCCDLGGGVGGVGKSMVCMVQFDFYCKFDVICKITFLSEYSESNT